MQEPGLCSVFRKFSSLRGNEMPQTGLLAEPERTVCSTASAHIMLRLVVKENRASFLPRFSIGRGTPGCAEGFDFVPHCCEINTR